MDLFFLASWADHEQQRAQNNGDMFQVIRRAKQVTHKRQESNKLCFFGQEKVPVYKSLQTRSTITSSGHKYITNRLMA